MTIRPKYVANRHFNVGRFTFAPGDPVPGGRALDLGIRFGFVDSTARRADTPPDPDTPTPETADHQETPS